MMIVVLTAITALLLILQGNFVGGGVWMCASILADICYRLEKWEKRP
jgi:hypothetical protein